MALSASGVDIQGSDFATRTTSDPKNKGNTAALKLMLVADPGFVFNLKLTYSGPDEPTNDSTPASVDLVWWVGYMSASNYRYNTIITMQLPNGRADLENELVFMVPFADPDFGQQAGPQSDYSLQVGAYVRNRAGEQLMYVDIAANAGHENVVSNQGFQFQISENGYLSAPPSAGPFGQTGTNDVVYNQVFFRPQGVGLQVIVPSRTVNSLAFSVWPNGNAAYACRVELLLYQSTFDSGKALYTLWLPFASIPGGINSATLVTQPDPSPSNLTNLTCALRSSDIRLTTNEVVISA